MEPDPFLRAFLEEKVQTFNCPAFIPEDPVSVPHRYHRLEDVEIAGFLAATIAWGSRKTILRNGHRLMDRLGESPFDFVMHASPEQLDRLDFTHRTFNSEDLRGFILGLRHIYRTFGTLRDLFGRFAEPDTLQPAISRFRTEFFRPPHARRSEKHISDPLKGSAAKRINMMLRWFVRRDNRGVDLGIWNGVLHPAQLSCPLDVHSGHIARALGILRRKQNDAEAVRELDAVLRTLDPTDPVKYDFALFGLGISREFDGILRARP
jgi:uncharacterized protein (TIGR02757 family)